MAADKPQERPETADQRTLDPHAGYERWAPSYDTTANPVVALDDQVLPPLFPDLRGQIILDAGCGTGRHTVRLARSAARVIALDYSAGMLAQAQAKIEAHAGHAPIDFHVHDLQTSPYPVAPASVDGAVCALVGEHLADLPTVFQAIAHALVPGGWLLFSVYHPQLAARGVQANFTEAATGVEYRLGAHKHLTADYVRALLGAGFTLRELREPVIDEDRAASVPRAAKYQGQPMLLILRATL